ncbi:O-methyltransferase [Luteipulveratus mongoliensis]|uniref:SAM-dependent methyltransferase n=1 Tax=Luteipulveratus mongoliensis TaxID=571913 RepID=A0A0K1JHZ9_9MICO|nr:O-methyltransferase [Luteipulveratus mongoliensis]AKU16336.1 SAM-dependent methyltransferase [Luteipulveratus mongoliensis]
MARSFEVTDQVQSYVVDHGSFPPSPVLSQLREDTAALGRSSGMQIGHDEGQLLTWLTRLVGARNAIEVGTFTGYSSLCIAEGLADGGRLLCCDVSEEWTALARGAWEKAGVADRIELRIAPALETLTALPDEPTIDLAFIDADKGGYVSYWDALVPRMRPGGVIATDNTLWSGDVVKDDSSDETLTAVKAFNDHVRADDRMETVMLPAYDGLTLSRRR